MLKKNSTNIFYQCLVALSKHLRDLPIVEKELFYSEVKKFIRIIEKSYAKFLVDTRFCRVNEFNEAELEYLN